MDTKMRKFLLIAILAMATTPALAQQGQDDCDIGARMRQAATEAADRERQMLEQIASREKQLALQASTSCIDKYLGLNLSSMLGFTSLDFGGIVQGIISGAANAACRVLDIQRAARVCKCNVRLFRCRPALRASLQRPRAAAGLQCVPAARRRRRSSKLSRQPAGGATRPLRAPLRPVPSGCGLGCAPCLSRHLAPRRNPAGALRGASVPHFRESPAAPRGGRLRGRSKVK